MIPSDVFIHDQIAGAVAEAERLLAASIVPKLPADHPVTTDIRRRLHDQLGEADLELCGHVSDANPIVTIWWAEHPTHLSCEPCTRALIDASAYPYVPAHCTACGNTYRNGHSTVFTDRMGAVLMLATICDTCIGDPQ